MGNETVNQETQNVEVEQKTFTQDEMNSIISERLGRERQKYQDYESLKEKAEQFDRIQEANKSELQKATERAEGLERELAELKKANEVQAIRQKISNETGVPISLLTGENEEDCLAMAKAINEYATPSTYPKVQDGGEVNRTLKPSTRDQFAEWINEQK